MKKSTRELVRRTRGRGTSYEHAGMYYLNDAQQGGWFPDEQSVLNALIALNNGDWAGTIQDAIQHNQVAFYAPLPILFSTIGTFGLQPSDYYATNSVPVVDLHGAGNDYLDGGDGVDTIEGGAGDNIIVNSSVSYTLGDNVEGVRRRNCAAIINSGNAANDEAAFAWMVAA